MEDRLAAECHSLVQDAERVAHAAFAGASDRREAPILDGDAFVVSDVA